MKRFVFVVVAFLLIQSCAFSQGMEEGTGFFSLGIGPSSSYVSYRTSATPAFRISYDKGFRELGPGTLTMGGMVGGFNSTYKDKWPSIKYNTYYNYKWSWTYIVAAFRLGYYYNFAELDVKELNAYAGLSVGPRLSVFSESYDGPADSGYIGYSNSGFGFHWGSFLGVNYFITPKTAIYTEFGYDISYFTLGVTFNM